MFFSPLANEPPLSGFAVIDLRNGHPVLDFDDSAVEVAQFTGQLPATYTGGADIDVDLQWGAPSATSGAVVWRASLERLDTATDIDADSFGTTVSSGAVTVPGTSGQSLVTTITLSGAGELDSIAAGERYRLRVERLATDAADTAAGDAELIAASVSEA